ncbi:glycosyltransferase WbuB [Hanstruepera neustonica]|uniref:Glycosyltransferase WbuB n=1 Tax=Hanstruepera neustonica TaxID=1445657 RepID=A0A2K1E3A1_9FLAO|nr:glycosyltransferase family 4 protein [Hanstruepera neustonica]PNQ74768.1 glycosyltransferase WbuB [Hanstruepera neustonica]
MKDLLIITNYFPPETGAASNRIFHLASGLKKNNFNVSVLTPLPNYPNGRIFEDFRGKFSSSSNENGIIVKRLWIFASNSKNPLLRLLAMLSYSFSLVWYFLWNKIPKTVIVQSPPLLVAFTCVLFLKSKNRKLILNVSDLWPLAGYELGVFKKNYGYKLLEKIERHNYKKADLILGQSEEILSHVTALIPDKQTFLYRNYPDFETPPNLFKVSEGQKIKLVYAGLLGIAQGIYKLCQELNYDSIEFHIYGAGAEKEKIELFVNENKSLPIFYHGEVTRKQLHKELLDYDLVIIPLLNRIYGSVPSKIFEYAKLGMPMLYFGGGEGEDIIKKYQLGWIAESGNYSELNKQLGSITKKDLSIDLRKRILETSSEIFNFENQLNKLKEVI